MTERGSPDVRPVMVSRNTGLPSSFAPRLPPELANCLAWNRDIQLATAGKWRDPKLAARPLTVARSVMPPSSRIEVLTSRP